MSLAAALPEIPTNLVVVGWGLLGLAAGLILTPLVVLFRDYDDDVTDAESGGQAAVDPPVASPSSPDSVEEPVEEPVGTATEPGLPPPPQCPHCGGTIPWIPGVPVPLAALWSRRCPHCVAKLAGPAVVPVLATVVLALLAARFGLGLELLAFTYIGLVGVVLAVIDARTRRLPNPLVLPAYPIAVALITAAALAPSATTAQLGYALFGLVGVGAFFLVLWLIHPAGMGWGDVKLSGILGLYLGWLGFANLLFGIFAAFLASSLVGLALMVAGRGTRKTQIPLGPFLLAGLLGAVLAGDMPQHFLGWD